MGSDLAQLTDSSFGKFVRSTVVVRVQRRGKFDKMDMSVWTTQLKHRGIGRGHHITSTAVGSRTGSKLPKEGLQLRFGDLMAFGSNGRPEVVSPCRIGV